MALSSAVCSAQPLLDCMMCIILASRGGGNDVCCSYIPSHSQDFIPNPIPPEKFYIFLILFPFPSHFHTPSPLFPIPIQIPKDRVF